MNNAELEAENNRLAQEVQRLQADHLNGELSLEILASAPKYIANIQRIEELETEVEEWEVVCDIKTLRIAALERQVEVMGIEGAALRQLVRSTDISVHYHFVP